MEKQNELQTITIGSGEEPYWSLCPGHVDAETFNKAHEAEGWDADAVEDKDLSFEWWVEKDGFYKHADKETEGAKPYTVLGW
jgi:hypothetical protein